MSVTPLSIKLQEDGVILLDLKNFGQIPIKVFVTDPKKEGTWRPADGTKVFNVQSGNKIERKGVNTLADGSTMEMTVKAEIVGNEVHVTAEWLGRSSEGFVLSVLTIPQELANNLTILRRTRREGAVRIFRDFEAAGTGGHATGPCEYTFERTSDDRFLFRLSLEEVGISRLFRNPHNNESGVMINFFGTTDLQNARVHDLTKISWIMTFRK